MTDETPAVTDETAAPATEETPTEAAPDPGNPAGGVHGAVAQEFVDPTAADTGIHGAVPQDFAAVYGQLPVTPTEPTTETPADPSAEIPVDPAAELPLEPPAETPTEPAPEPPAA